jgi:DNA-directed RNA polymerase alpha subunit
LTAEGQAEPIDAVNFPTRIRNALTHAGLKTIGEVRETPDEVLHGGCRNQGSVRRRSRVNAADGEGEK